MDTTFIPMQKEFVHLSAVLDRLTLRVRAWHQSKTLTAPERSASENGDSEYGPPENMKTDQSSPFTSSEFVYVPEQNDIQISKDGKVCGLDSVYVEPLWRSV